MLVLSLAVVVGCEEQVAKPTGSPGDALLDTSSGQDAMRPFDAMTPVDARVRDFNPLDIGAPDMFSVRDGELDATSRVDGEVPVALPDLELLRDKLLEDVWLDEIFVTEDSCAFIERCVSGTGMRRLLRFSVATANVGEVDLVMGRPTDHLTYSNTAVVTNIFILIAQHTS